MLVAQHQLNPAVTVAATAAREAGKDATSPAPAPPDLLSPWPAGLRPMSNAETFTPETLSDKINGKAELYLSAGFVALSCQRVALACTPDAWMEMFVFDMGRPTNAFSVFSSQRRPGGQDQAVGDYSYRAGNQLCLVHGPYYIEIVAAEDRDPTLAAAINVARAFVAATTVVRHADVSRDQALFPPDGLIADSVMLLSADVFGFDQLKHVFVARYNDGEDEATLFLTRRENPADAAQMAGALINFFVRDCGGTETVSPEVPAGAVIIDSGGLFDGVLTTGPFLAGVHQAPSREAAGRWIIRLHQHLSSSRP